jgi:hypothetical protein
MDDTDIAAAVDGLLAAAGFRPTPEERARLIGIYPRHRHNIDALYAIDEVRYEAPGTIFIAEPRFTDWSS